jgi:hypothetical protein
MTLAESSNRRHENLSLFGVHPKENRVSHTCGCAKRAIQPPQRSGVFATGASQRWEKG